MNLLATSEMVYGSSPGMGFFLAQQRLLQVGLEGGLSAMVPASAIPCIECYRINLVIAGFNGCSEKTHLRHVKRTSQPSTQRIWNLYRNLLSFLWQNM